VKKIFAFIFARGGSKGLPGKNIRPLAGKPLISYSIEIALQDPSISKVLYQQTILTLLRSQENWALP